MSRYVLHPLCPKRKVHDTESTSSVFGRKVSLHCLPSAQEADRNIVLSNRRGSTSDFSHHLFITHTLLDQFGDVLCLLFRTPLLDACDMTKPQKRLDFLAGIDLYIRNFIKEFIEVFLRSLCVLDEGLPFPRHLFFMVGGMKIFQCCKAPIAFNNDNKMRLSI